MSYVSGFMLGASIGKAIHGMFCKDDIPAGAYQDAKASNVSNAQPGMTAPLSMGETAVPVFACVSALKGRRRYRAAALVGNQALAELLQRKIAGLKAIQTVQVSAVTGSILLCSKNEGMLDTLEIFLRSRIFKENENQQQESLVMQQNSNRAAYRDTLYETLDLFNGIISKKTANVLDLRSLVSLVFIIRGMRKMIMLNQRPSGPQMLWWAASLMRGGR